MFTDTRPGERAVADRLMSVLTEMHGEGVHVADLTGGAAILLCTLMDSYGGPGRTPTFLRGLADRYEADPLTASRPSASRSRN
ncbi:hypothetical protein NZL82_15530 [Sphingomonas sanguinis]|uniref:hypothetical protein n=1 Tax=Sphingomonas sp. LC-1 TaxID=3110957 RepID=UPI0021BA94B0|nr:hypothetical protein [Sphingomonas sp. LC-1]MCT8003287.1 hypothetical protein [Sphingomonas sp. LC-1]